MVRCSSAMYVAYALVFLPALPQSPPMRCNCEACTTDNTNPSDCVSTTQTSMNFFEIVRGDGVWCYTIFLKRKFYCAIGHPAVGVARQNVTSAMRGI